MKVLLTSATLVLTMISSSASFATGNVDASKAPTIRTLSGAATLRQLNASQTALIVIDFQNEYFDGKMPVPDGMKALKQSRKLVDFAHKNGMPVFFIRNEGPADSPLFAKGSHSADFYKELLPGKGDIIITKTTPSSFIGTDLDTQMKKRGIKTLVVMGLMTHMCVSSTVRDAVPLGYQVIIPEDATATRNLAAWDNSVVSSSDLQRAALAGVADVFADIKTTQQILDMPVIR